MYETIHRTPADLRRLAGEGWEPARAAASVVGEATRVFCVGIGTSYHAAANAAFHLRWAGVDAEAVSSFDFTVYETPLKPTDAVMVFGHRGFKRFSAASLDRARTAGVPVIAVTGLESQVHDATVILTTTPQEKSAAFTASHSGAMYASAQVACLVAEARHMDASALRTDLGWRHQGAGAQHDRCHGARHALRLAFDAFDRGGAGVHAAVQRREFTKRVA